MGPTSSFSLHEAAAELDVHYMTVYRHVRNGRLNATRTASGWEVSAEALSDYSKGVRPDRTDRRRHFEERLIAHDDAALWRVVQGELASGNSAADVLSDFIVPSLQSIGMRWKSGDLTILDEHQSTAAAAVVVARLGPHIRRLASSSQRNANSRVLVGAPSGDTHALAPAIVSDLLRAAGFQTIELGASTPADSFAEVVTASEENDQPISAVAISVHLDLSDRFGDAHRVVQDTVSTIRATGTAAQVFVGGAGSSAATADALGCDRVTSSINDLIELISA